MRLYLIRHGDAARKDADSEKTLTDKGAFETKKIAEFLKKAKIEAAEVRHSGKKRAAQTAQTIAWAVAPGTSPVAVSGLAPNDPVEPLKEKLAELREDLVLVGHLPHLENLARLLLSGGRTSPAVDYPPSGALCLERDDEGLWSLRWMIVPEIL
jgi:phosphohistidine phosphatase